MTRIITARPWLVNGGRIPAGTPVADIKPIEMKVEDGDNLTPTPRMVADGICNGQFTIKPEEEEKAPAKPPGKPVVDE